MIYPDQSRYEGEFENGKANGRGVRYYANGNIHDGNWFENKQHGSGTFYSVQDGQYKQGTWNNGKLDMWQISGQKVKGDIGGGRKPRSKKDISLAQFR